MADNLHDILDRQVARRPEAPALQDTFGAVWNYAELADKSRRLATEFADLGLRANDRVLILTENCALAVAMLFAVSRVGATAIPANARQSVTEIDRILAHANPALVICLSRNSQEAATHSRRLHAREMSGYDVLVRPSDPDPVLNDVATVLYTTGTTGAPKGVMLTHSNVTSGGEASRVTRDLRSDDVFYGVLPVSHVFGLVSVVMGAVTAGASVRLEPRFSPQALYRELISGLTVLSAVPQMHALLMQFAKERGYDHLPSETLRYVSSGAAPLDPDWKSRAEAFYRVPLQNGYGMTETSAGICMTRQITSNDDISVGFPFPGAQIKIDRQAPGAEGDVGEILVRGATVMKGYFRNARATRDVFTETGWLRTGDLGRTDTAGNLHISGRSKELIIHGGFNVYPPEVEAVLSRHPQVIQAAVIGVMQDGDEKIAAFVEVAEGDWPEVSDLHRFVAERLSGYKCPAQIILTGKLPAATTGKILKHRLSELLPH